MVNNIILYDGDSAPSLYPLTLTKPIAELRIGILTIKEKWVKYLNANASFHTSDYLSNKFAPVLSDDNVFIHGSVLPDQDVIDDIRSLGTEEGLLHDGELLAYRASGIKTKEQLKSTKSLGKTPKRILHPEQIFKQNQEELIKDFRLITEGRISQKISHTNQTFGEDIFVEEGAYIECSVLNAEPGPIYIGKGAKILEGNLIRGALAMCEGSILKMGGKIYGATTLGPRVKFCGEVNNVVVQANSNKGHAGYLGNSVIGEWCNFGAGTIASNMKNNYAEVKLWDYTKDAFRNTGTQFCGLIMGDHSKTGINTMFNTGTVVGVGCNVFGAGYPRTFIPSFSWGGRENNVTNKLSKCLEVASVMMPRREQELTEADVNILTHIFKTTAKNRKWEK